eukprot:326860-Chlamydomonas_euryale.AAC.1
MTPVTLLSQVAKRTADGPPGHAPDRCRSFGSSRVSSSKIFQASELQVSAAVGRGGARACPAGPRSFFPPFPSLPSPSLLPLGATRRTLSPPWPNLSRRCHATKPRTTKARREHARGTASASAPRRDAASRCRPRRQEGSAGARTGGEESKKKLRA